MFTCVIGDQDKQYQATFVDDKIGALFLEAYAQVVSRHGASAAVGSLEMALENNAYEARIVIDRKE